MKLKNNLVEGVLRTARLAFLATLLLLAGCCSTPVSNSLILVPAYKPSNIYRANQFLPPGIRRVAVLPMTIQPGDWQAEAGKRELVSVLDTELGKVKAFERVEVTTEQLQALTGRPAWRAEEELPQDFFEKLQQAIGCDAVIFAHLGSYHAYKPIVVGWNLKLVEVRNHTIVWAADEVFDAAKPSVAKAALCFWREQPELFAPSETEAALISPRRFSQYTLCALLETIPPHGRQ